MILFYSYKDSFNENFNFDFSKKDRIKYNLEEIEEIRIFIITRKKEVYREIRICDLSI